LQGNQSEGIGVEMMSSTGYNDEAEKIYEIEKTKEFDKWFDKLKDESAKAVIAERIERFEGGNIGDSRHIENGLNELRIHCGAGYRVYWFRIGEKVVLLAFGGDKSTQKRNIKKAQKIMMAYREEQR